MSISTLSTSQPYQPYLKSFESEGLSYSYITLNCIKASLVKARDKMDDDYLQSTIDTFTHRIRKCIAEGSDRVEEV